MALFGLFGDDEPRAVLVRNPNFEPYAADADYGRMYIMVRTDSEGNISAREYMNENQKNRMIEDGEAVEAQPRDLERLRSGKIKISDIARMYKDGERRSDEEMEEEMQQRSKKSSPLSSERRRSRLERIEEQAINPEEDNNGGNY